MQRLPAQCAPPRVALLHALRLTQEHTDNAAATEKARLQVCIRDLQERLASVTTLARGNRELADASDTARREESQAAAERERLLKEERCDGAREGLPLAQLCPAYSHDRSGRAAGRLRDHACPWCVPTATRWQRGASRWRMRCRLPRLRLRRPKLAREVHGIAAGLDAGSRFGSHPPTAVPQSRECRAHASLLASHTLHSGRGHCSAAAGIRQGRG